MNDNLIAEGPNHAAALALYYSVLGNKYSFDDYRGANGIHSERRAEAKLDGLRFAVEWYAGEVAREYCNDI